MPEKYITPEQAAYLLGIGLRSLWRLIARASCRPRWPLHPEAGALNRRDLFRFMQRTPALAGYCRRRRRAGVPDTRFQDRRSGALPSELRPPCLRLTRHGVGG